VLLIGASLLIESLARLHNVDPGFQSENVLTMHVSLPGSRYDGGKRRAFWEELARRVETLPGVRSATVAQTLPMTVRNATQMAIAELPPVKVAERPLGMYGSILPGYFRTLGIPLRRGREFGENDAPGSGPMVAIIDESLARRFWPGYPGGQDPIGRHLLLGDAQQGGVEIVGIVGSVRVVGLAVDALPEIYIPMAHHPVTDADLAVRAEGDPLRLVNAVRSQVLEIDRDQPVSAVRTMEEIVDSSIGRRELTMLLLSVFAGVALLMAVVGLYGAIAYSVAQRTQEIAIRRALGAQEADVLRMVIGQGLGLTLAGLALGIGAALALTRFTKSLLFDTSATDPATFVSIAALFVVVALLASSIPARRATLTDSTMALRAG
jgi:predicted permease